MAESRRRWEGGLLLFYATMTAVATVGYFVKFEMKRLFPETTVATTANELKIHAFGDGSSVALGGSTRLRCNVDGNPRHVWLVQGEAMFHVMANTTAPFRVSNSLVTARAMVDAKFSMRIDRGAWLHVYDGAIEVSVPGSPVSIIVERGHEYHVPSEGRGTVVAAASAVGRRVHRWSSEKWAGGVLAGDPVLMCVARVSANRFPSRRLGAPRGAPRHEIADRLQRRV